MRYAFILKSAVAAAMGFVLFGLMQVLLGSAHCFDCGARVGFPFSYMQDGTYATHGHIIWRGLAADCSSWPRAWHSGYVGALARGRIVGTSEFTLR